MKNVAKNFFYQAIFQVAKIIMPIITIPIVSNALGPSGIGLYNYTNSVVQYFVLIAGLGIQIYGNREIAISWNSARQDTSKIFWEIFTFKFIVTLLTCIVYVLIVWNLPNRIFFLVQGLILFSVIFDISWFFMGIEDFKKTSMSNLFVQFITFISIVLFIKDKNDVLLYTVIQALGILFSQILVWLFVKRYIQFVPFSLKDSLAHLKKSFEFFIPQVAIMLYTNLNKTILGLFLGAAAVGYYTNSIQINNIFITIITTIDLVLLPHMSGYFAKNDEKRIIDTMEKTVHLELFFSIPIMFGMLTVYDKLIPWFFGKKFLFLNHVIPFFTILIVVIPLGMAISRQYLMPIGKVNEYNKSVIHGAVISVISNLLLLPMIGFFGVVISNILAEVFVTYVRTRSFLKTTSFSFRLKQIGVFMLSGFLMCVITRWLTQNMAASFVTNIIQLLIAVPIYFVLTMVLKENVLIKLLLKK